MTDQGPVVAVLGAGSWGTALAMQLQRSGSHAILWGRNPAHLAEIAEAGSNERFLPGLPLSREIAIQPDLAAAVAAADHLLVVVPSHAFGGMLGQLAPILRPGQGVAWACKGFEPGSGRLLHEVAREVLPADTPLAVVTGPSFASEVARDLPTAVTVAGLDEAFATTIARALHGGRFRAYTAGDVVGAELGGAVKNVLAIGTGICDGMGLGDNARAALITRGLAELMRLGQAMGARPETLMGLAGVGDLVLTCTGDLSRNRRLGLALGRGEDAETALRAIGQVVEGVKAATEVHRLAQSLEVSMPISRQVYGLLNEGWDAEECVRRLLAREQKAEVS
ncbi:MAG: NAD(P)-dependent glycerol-3-phosphate dehydrogenase [Xanthomonadales bacterium]|nr:NAD(P)-dependent glycerol-3-phosphate dehydrogenase [Xanthomonadales bacterium]